MEGRAHPVPPRRTPLGRGPVHTPLPSTPLASPPPLQLHAHAHPHPHYPHPHPLPPTPTPGEGRKQVGDWLIGRTIGEGSSGKVKLATHQVTGHECVVKAVRRPRKPTLLLRAAAVTSNPLAPVGPAVVYGDGGGGGGAPPSTSLPVGGKALQAQAHIISEQQQPQQQPEEEQEQEDALQKFHKRELYMIREAVIGMSLHHPNIVHLNSAVLGQNHFYCFFDYMEGEDLVDYITRHGRLKEKRARSIFRALVSAVEFTHRNHIVQ
jgi:serine/threonine protein kinase